MFVQIPAWAPRTVACDVQLGVVIGEPMLKVSLSRAMDHVAGYCCAMQISPMYQECSLDELVPSRDHPGSVLDHACPVGGFIPKNQIPEPCTASLWMRTNSYEARTVGFRHMIWPVSHLLCMISRYVELQPNDVVLTGSPFTPQPVHTGDTVVAQVLHAAKDSDINEESKLSVSFS